MWNSTTINLWDSATNLTFAVRLARLSIRGRTIALGMCIIDTQVRRIMLKRRSIIRLTFLFRKISLLFCSVSFSLSPQQAIDQRQMLYFIVVWIVSNNRRFLELNVAVALAAVAIAPIACFLIRHFIVRYVCCDATDSMNASTLPKYTNRLSFHCFVAAFRKCDMFVGCIEIDRRQQTVRWEILSQSVNDAMHRWCLFGMQCVLW